MVDYGEHDWVEDQEPWFSLSIKGTVDLVW